jgi:hypothetical protein
MGSVDLRHFPDSALQPEVQTTSPSFLTDYDCEIHGATALRARSKQYGGSPVSVNMK